MLQGALLCSPFTLRTLGIDPLQTSKFATSIYN